MERIGDTWEKKTNNREQTYGKKKEIIGKKQSN